MSVAHRSTLPAVLKQYVSNYEAKPPNKQNKPAPVASQQTERKPSRRSEDASAPVAAKRTKSPSATAARPSVTRERSTVDAEKQKQHARKTYEQWHSVQRSIKDEDTDILKKKIHLQLTLIRQQQALAEYNRQCEEEEKKQKREEERRQKREIAEALLRTCKESLENDKRTKRKERREAAAQQNPKPSTPGATSQRTMRTRSQYGGDDVTEDYVSRGGMTSYDGGNESEDDATIATAPSPTKPRVTYEGMVAKEPTGFEDTPESTKPSSPVTRDGTLIRDYARDFTRGSTLAEMEEEDEEEQHHAQEAEPDEYADLPWHHQQLYKLYGKTRADSFLYPKIDTQKKKTNKPLDPKFVAEGGGRLSANELWAILRGESQAKLYKVDAAIPLELKDAYGCFARESISKSKQAVRRSFNRPGAQEEADMERIQDHSRVVGAQHSRHQLEIMYRSSHMNEDRAHVLQYNNPIPDLNNMEGNESVARYLPSWVDEEDKESVQSYLKWVHGTQAQDTATSLGQLSLADKARSARKKKLPAITESGDSKQNESPQANNEPTSAGAEASGRGEWDFMFDSRPSRPAAEKQPTYIFLTEKKARTPGQFSKRRREMLEAKNKPKGYEMPMSAPAQKAASAMGMLESNGSFIESSSLSLGSSSANRSQSAFGKAPQVLWPPLSMNAVQEYKLEKTAPGQGEFKNGKEAVWATQEQVAVN